MASTNKYATSPVDLDSLAERARSLVAQQRWADAAKALTAVISARRNSFRHSAEQARKLASELSDLAHVQLSQSQADLAAASAREAIAVDPKNAFAHCNLGGALRASGNYREAAASYAAGAAINPNLVQASFFQATALAEAGDAEAAVQIWRSILPRIDDRAAALRDIVAVMMTRGLGAHAGEFALAAMQFKPADVATLSLFSNALAESSNFSEAESAAREAVATAGKSLALAQLALGTTFHKQKRYGEAINAYRSAIANDPMLARAHSNLGDALLAHSRSEDDVALSHLTTAAELQPADPYVQLKLSTALLQTSRPIESIAVSERVLKSLPDSIDAMNNLGIAQHDNGQYEPAIATFQRALQLSPHNADAHRNLGISYLSRGDLALGWPEYAYRPKPPVDARLEPWDGSDLHGAPIALVAEQGFGDSIQFVRYANWVRNERNGRVILLLPKALERLLKHVGGSDFEIVTSFADLAADVSLYQSLMTLPMLASTNSIEQIPAATPYLRAPAMTDALRERLASLGTRRPRVGLVWAGNASYSNDRRRSIAIESFAAPLAPLGSLVSLQVGDAAKRDRSILDDLNILRVDDLLTDFADTAAVIEQLDLVISADTAVAHLAGALNKPVWIMLPKVSDWRWMREQVDSPWYPSARLFRQQTANDWNEVGIRIAESLRELGATPA